MSHLEDIFAGDIDENSDIENIIEENNVHEANESDQSGNEDNPEDESEQTAVKVKPKRVVRNPQPKLDPERLRGARGIATLEDFFKDVKYKGKGHEKEDLQCLMMRLEHWCHRLFPKYQFDDCLERIEKLGAKKIVQTFVKKVRLGMVETETLGRDIVQSDEEELPAATDDGNVDAFDLLLDQQLAEARSKPQQHLFQPRQDRSDEPEELTEEQKDRIEQNRRLAVERRLAKIRETQQSASNESVVVGDSNMDTENEINAECEIDNLNTSIDQIETTS